MNGAMEILRILGVILALRVSYICIRVLTPYLRSSKLHRYLKTKDGRPAWALITGASSGIGKGFADQLASRGFNIVLHGRNPSKLERVKSELQKRHPARDFRVLVADAEKCINTDHHPSKTVSVSFPAIARSVADINLKILINNAGNTIPRSAYETIDAYTAEELAENICLLAVFPTLMTATLLPALLRGGEDEPGLVINVGSLADNGSPLLPTYAPCKAFLAASSVELAREMKLDGRSVDVLGLRVGEVYGTAFDLPGPSFLVPDVEDVVGAALARVGCGRPVVIPYWPHALQDALLRVLPDPVVDRLFCDELRRRRLEQRAKAAKRL